MRLAVTLAGVALLATAAPQVAVAQEASAARKAPSQAAAAKRLAGAVLAARTGPARERAIRRIMKALEIGVVTRDGQPMVVSPKPNSAQRFHLYDFELRAMATGLQRKDTFSLDDVAARLTKAGLGLGAMKPFPPELLRLALHSAVREAARRPRSKRALLSLVVRELGRRRGMDLARPLPAEQIKLDALQSFLITADFVIPVLRKIPAPSGASRSAGPRARAAALTDVCDRYNEAVDRLDKALEEAQGGKIGKRVNDEIEGAIADKAVEGMTGRRATRWGIKNLPRWAVRGAWRIGKLASRLNVVKQLAGAAHAAVLAGAIEVSAPSELPETHYLHREGETGRQLTFEVSVVMTVDLGKAAVKCGALAGMKFPPPGPVEGVPILWDQVQSQLAPRHGRFSDCGTPCTTNTGMDGKARLTFFPKSEAFPGVGMAKEDVGAVSGLAIYQSAQDAGLLGEVWQFAAPKYETTRWRVWRHDESLVLDVEATITQSPSFEPSTADVRVTGLPLTSAGGAITGEAPLTLAGYGVGPGDCWTHIWKAAPASPFKVSSMTIDRPDGRPAPPPVIRMTLDPGSLSETVTHTCGGDSSTTYTDERKTYRDGMTAMIADGTLADWEYVDSSSVWARRTVSVSTQDLVGRATFELRRVPGP